jgi:hypothetical protein
MVFALRGAVKMAGYNHNLKYKVASASAFFDSIDGSHDICLSIDCVSIYHVIVQMV